MSAENEEVFAANAQEQALLSRRRTRQSPPLDDAAAGKVVRRANNSEDADAPLLTSLEIAPVRNSLKPSRKSYDRAINQPWLGAPGAANLPWYKTPSIAWLLPAFLPFTLAFGGLIVPRTYLILNLICRNYLTDKASKDPTFTFLPVLLGEENPQCRVPEVQTLTANFQLYSSLISGIFSAIISPHLGSLSDRIGRRRVMAFATMGAFVQEVITILAGTYPESFSVYLILIGNLLDGLCGSFTTAMALSFAYASDCTPPERRNVAFGLFHGTLFIGIAVGPIIASFLIKASGTVMIVFYVALGCHLFFILFLLFVIPESVSQVRQLLAREQHRVKNLDTQDDSWFTTLKNYNLFAPLAILWPKGEGTSTRLRRNLVLLAAIDGTMFGVAMGTLQIILIYAEYQFGWTAVDSSLYLSSTSICRVTGLIVLLPLVTRLIRGPMTAQPSGNTGSDMLDIILIRAAILFDLSGYVGYAVARSSSVMIASGMVASLGGIGSPTLQSSLTKHIPSHSTGQMLGATGLLHALARVIAPVFSNLIYGRTVGKFSQAVFVCLSSAFVLSFIMSWFLKPGVYIEEPACVVSHEDDEHEET